MSPRTKEILSMLAAFIAGFAPAYYANPAPSAWPGWVVAGLVSFGVWVGGYSQTNPRLQPRTPEALLASVQASTLAPEARAKVEPLLAKETISESATKEGKP